MPQQLCRVRQANRQHCVYPLCWLIAEQAVDFSMTCAAAHQLAAQHQPAAGAAGTVMPCCSSVVAGSGGGGRGTLSAAAAGAMVASCCPAASCLASAAAAAWGTAAGGAAVPGFVSAGGEQHDFLRVDSAAVDLQTALDRALHGRLNACDPAGRARSKLGTGGDTLNAHVQCPLPLQYQFPNHAAYDTSA
jgi:hypothetical protein